jgi:hypothetical protein
MAGTVIAGMYKKFTGNKKDSSLWSMLAIAGVLMIIAGFVIRPYTGGISKYMLHQHGCLFAPASACSFLNVWYCW